MAASAELTSEMYGRATWVNIESQGYVSAAMTLDGFFNYWVISMLDYPYQLSTNTPLEAARIWGLNFLNAHPGVDGSQLNELYPAYGNFLAAALNGQPLPALPPPPFSTGTGEFKSIPGVVHSDTPAIPAPPPPIDQSVPNPALAALMTTGTPAPAAAPAPTTVDTTTNPAAGVEVKPPGPTPKFIAAAGGLISGGVGIGVSAATAAVTFGVSIVATVLLSLFTGGLFGGSDTKALQQAVNQLRQAQAQIADELERFSWSIAVGLGRLWQAVAGIWDNFLDALWTYMKRLWNLLWTVVSEVIPKMIQVLRDLRKFLDSMYVRYILPALRYLLLIRQVLLVLRALHIPIAQRLDKILGQIQGALYVPMLGLANVVGGYGAWINVILTNRYTLQRPVFIRTMNAYSNDWINLWWVAQTPLQTGFGGPPAAGGGMPSNDAAILAELHQYVTTGSGPMAADAADAQAMLAATRAGNA